MDDFIAQATLYEPRNRIAQMVTDRNENGHGKKKAQGNIRMATINVSTLKDKEEEIIEMMKARRLDILGLCETRCKNSGQRRLHEDYKIIYSGVDDGRHGVAFMLTPQIAETVDSIDHKSERILGITLKLRDQKISVIQIYAPQQGRSIEEKEEFYNSLQEVYEGMKYQENVIVVGDMNGHVGQDRTGVENVIGDFSIGNKNPEGERIIDFCVLNGLAIMNTYYKHKESHKWTWYRWNEQQQNYTEKSMIDLFLTNKKNLFRDVRTIPSVSFDSDHRMVIAKLKTGKPKVRSKRKQKRFKLENLKNEDNVHILKEKIKQQKPREQEMIEMDVEEQWNRMKKVVYESAEEAIGIKIKYATKKKNTAWWTTDVKNAVKEKAKAFRKWMKTRRQDDRQEYVEKRNSAETIKRRAKNEVWIKIGQELEEDIQGKKKLLYSMAKNYRKGNTESVYTIRNNAGTDLLTEPNEIASRWKEYFEELLNVGTEEEWELDRLEIQEIEDEQVHERLNEISIEEVEHALKEMKNGKAPGDDELPIEIFMAAGVEGMHWLKIILNTAWRQEKVPADWQKAIVCPIYKKGEKSNCANYRGISLLSHVGKVYERIVEARLRWIVEHKLGNWQHGFRPNRSTMDLVFTLKIILEKSWEWNKKQYVGFIDLEKAFDRIDRNNLWRVLQYREYSINKKLIRVIMSIYENTQSRVKNREIESEWFNIRTGVRQGGVLSPLLFIIYMDRCMREICMNEDKEITLAYADDVAVVTGNKEDLQAAMTKWNDIMERMGMKISKQKTEVMEISRVKDGCNIYIENIQLKQTASFNYLGVLFDEENKHQTEITNRLNKYNGNVNALYPILKDKNVPSKAKVIIYTKVLRPILIYGAETWSLTKKSESRVQAAEMRVLRMILGVTRRDRIRNDVIRERLNITSVLKIIEKSKLRWYGHVKRMEENRYPRKYLDWIPQGRRPVGRPRKRWIQGIEDAVQKRGRSLEEINQQEEYQDRLLWRRFVEAGQ